MKKSTGLYKFKTFADSSVFKLKKTGRFLWKILTVSLVEGIIFPEKNLCVSIGITGVSVAYGSRFLYRIHIKEFRDFRFEDEITPENFAACVSLAVNELKAGKTDITLSIPKAWAIIQPVEFPIAVKADLSNAVLYELDRLTPISSENALYDFSILKEKDGLIHILLVVARADLVNRYIEALSKKGISVKRVTVNLSCINALLNYIDKGANTVFAEIGKNGYEGGLITDGSIVSGFTGRFYAEDKEEWADAVTNEIRPLIASHGGQAPSVRIIADYKDGHALFPEQKLSMPVQNMQDMNIKLRFSNNRQNIKDAPRTAIGGVLESLWTKGWKPNLLGRGINKESGVPVAVTAFLLLSLIVMGIFWYITPLRMEKQELREIDRQMMLMKDEIVKIQKIIKEVDLISGEISAIGGFKYNNPMALAVLKELTTVLPKTVWLTRVHIAGRIVEIEGYAGNATEILPILEASPFFEKVEFASATTRDANMKADRFSLKMELDGLINQDRGVDIK